MDEGVQASTLGDELARASVLVVDDAQLSLRLMTEILARQGYQVRTASDGEQALASVQVNPPDLILLDIMMPGLSGYDVCERLKASAHTRDIPVIFLSALEEVLDKVKAFSLGAVDYITKPFEIEEVVARVKLHLTVCTMQKKLKAQNTQLQREIADRQRAEKALRESEKRYRMLFDNMPVGLYRTTPDGDVVDANPALARMLGCPDRESLLAGNVSAFYVDTSRRGRWQAMMEREGEVHNFEGEMRRLDGVLIWARGSAHVMRDSEGQVLYYEGALEDITHRKRAEDALRRYAHEQTVLYEITATATRLLDQDALLAAILDKVLSALESDAGWAALVGATPEDPPRIVAWQGVPQTFIATEMCRSLQGHRRPATLEADGPGETDLGQTNRAQTEPILVTDGARLPAELATGGHPHYYVVAPLIVGDQALGFLHIAWRAARPYTDADHRLLTAIGHSVGLALHNARLYQAARQVDRLRVLTGLDEALVATLDLETIAQTSLQQLASALRAPQGILLLPPAEAEPQRLRVYALGQAWGEKAFDPAEAAAWELWRQRFQADEGKGNVLFSGDELAALTNRLELDQIRGSGHLALPFWDNAALIAVMVLGGWTSGRLLTDEDRALARAAANLASQAIRNARLYQASREQAARLATLNAISEAAVSSLEADVVLRHILELTCQTLAAPAGSILLNNLDTGGLIFTLTLVGEVDVLRGYQLASGQGIAGWVAQTGQAMRVDDVRQEPRWYDALDQATGLQTRSLACAPLRHRDQVSGVIEVLSQRVGQFTDEDLNLLEAIASIAAVALANARLYAAMRSYADRMVLLYQLGHALTASLDFAMVVRVALDRIQSYFLAQNVILFQADQAAHHLCKAWALDGGEPVEIDLDTPPGEGLAGWSLQHGQVLLLNDAPLDARFSAGVDQHLGIQTHALMAAPLLTRDRVVGVIEVISDEPDIYNDDELNSLQAMASTLSVALENARLYEDLKALLHEREQTQAQLIRSEKMAALGRLTVSLTHEINNPLQALRSGFHLLLNQRARTQKRQRYLEVANHEVERLIAIVERVLGFYRPSSNDQPQPVDVNALLEETLLLVNKKLEHGRVNVVQCLSPDLPRPEAVGDQLKQVFLNIIFNAQQSMPEGGVLRVETTQRTEEGMVCAAFSDNGVGIPAERIPHLFEPFFTTRMDGSGLGLTISYSIVERHGGRIEVASTPGVGSTFTVVLPVEVRQQ